MVALSHPCRRLPIEAAIATRAAPAIFSSSKDEHSPSRTQQSL
jgi:hypothetical protein